MNIYTRGQFALIGKVSVKALRIYDELGLLKPVHIDPNNQYRYYSAEQIDEINTINELKIFGFSLEEIKELKEKNDTEYMKERLAKRLKEIDTEIEKNYRLKYSLTKKIGDLSDITQPQNSFKYEIQIVKIEDMAVACLRELVNIQDVGRLIR